MYFERPVVVVVAAAEAAVGGWRAIKRRGGVGAFVRSLHGAQRMSSVR